MSDPMFALESARMLAIRFDVIQANMFMERKQHKDSLILAGCSATVFQMETDVIDSNTNANHTCCLKATCRAG